MSKRNHIEILECGKLAVIHIDSNRHGRVEVFIDASLINKPINFTSRYGDVATLAVNEIRWSADVICGEYYVLGNVKVNGKWTSVYLHRFIKQVFGSGERVITIDSSTVFADGVMALDFTRSNLEVVKVKGRSVAMGGDN